MTPVIRMPDFPPLCISWKTGTEPGFRFRAVTTRCRARVNHGHFRRFPAFDHDPVSKHCYSRPP